MTTTFESRDNHRRYMGRKLSCATRKVPPRDTRSRTISN